MHAELVVAKIVVMVLGFVIAYNAFRGYRRTRSPPLLYLAAGFVVISFGAVIEGMLYELDLLTIYQASAVQTSIVGVGMLLILYSLYGGTSAEVPPDRDEG